MPKASKIRYEREVTKAEQAALDTRLETLRASDAFRGADEYTRALVELHQANVKFHTDQLAALAKEHKAELTRKPNRKRKGAAHASANG